MSQNAATENGLGSVDQVKEVLRFFIRRAKDAQLEGTVEFLERRLVLINVKTPDKLASAMRATIKALRTEASDSFKVANELHGEPRDRLLAGAHILETASLQFNREQPKPAES